MHVSEESDSGMVPMKPSNNDGRTSAEKGEGRPLIEGNTPQAPHAPDTERATSVPGAGGCAESFALRRQSSEIRAVCANERTYGSVRGAAGNRCPYRDRFCWGEARQVSWPGSKWRPKMGMKRSIGPPRRDVNRTALLCATRDLQVLRRKPAAHPVLLQIGVQAPGEIGGRADLRRENLAWTLKFRSTQVYFSLQCHQ
jgi:hypothetical protein